FGSSQFTMQTTQWGGTLELNEPLPGLDFRPAERYVIQSIEELRVIANPLRLRVLDCLILEPLTVKQVGEKLGISSKKLYYHVGELERIGLVRLVHTEVQSGIQLKYYRAVAAYYYLTASMLHSDRVASYSGASGEFLAFLLESSAGALRRSVANGTIDSNPDSFIVSRRRLRLSPAQATALRDILKAQESAVLSHDDPDGELTMSYVFALFPVNVIGHPEGR
ncbi:MAG TPA: helix-turn-helix domain-containing protein, partial [Nitrolancea sp.]|nr:helix-turn-helix domain-containing protein [Nitrolancea sp.]